jgi:flagellin-like hook-associated protein FlgL
MTGQDMNNIQFDYTAQSALNTMRVSARATALLTDQLSTGRSIQSASDDAARLSIGSKMTSQYQGLLRATQNLHDGLSLAQTAEGALGTIVDSLQRMRELALQAANGTLTNTDRVNLDHEYQTHKEQILNTIQETTWNDHRLFQELSPTTFELQAGPNSNDRFTIEIPQIYASGTTVAFTNGDFESGSVGDTSITGWTLSNTRVTLDGNSQIGGWPTPIDTTKPGNSPGDTEAMTSGTFGSQLVNPNDVLRGNKSLQMQSTNARVANGFGILHGPSVISNASTPLKVGDTVSFDWKAEGGQDSYDVYAYLLNVDNGSTVKLLDSTGTTTQWATQSATVPTAGNYKFVFVSGSFDQTGGRLLGARLFVDNITAPPTTNATLNSTNIRSQADAGVSIAEVDLNISSVDKARASLGASINRINHAADNITNYSRNIAESRSKMLDTDYVAATTELSRSTALHDGASLVLRQSRENMQSGLQMIRTNDQLFKN